MNKKSLRIAVVMPAYNEGRVIGEVVKNITSSLQKAGYSHEVIVVNDGSRDNTSSLAKKHGATVIDHILNSGTGSATATGLSYAQQNNFDIAVTMDSDGQHDPKDAIQGIEIISKIDADLLIGSRLMDPSGMSNVKILGNKGLSSITHLLFGIRVTDSQSGLRVFSRKALESLRWKTSGYEFCSEMLWRANQLGLKISEYPIKAIYTDYSKSKGQSNWNAFNIVRSLISQRIMEMFGE